MFKFKGISSDEMGVVTEDEEIFIAKASKRYETIDIEGKDGSIYNELGYLDIDRSIKIQILDINKLDKIFSWLDGVGILEYKDRVSRARFYSTIEPIRAACIKIAEFSFIREPFWYKKDDEFISVNSNIVNEGNVTSRPVIRLEKVNTHSIDLTINNVRLKYTFPENEEYVEINCEDINVLYNNLNRFKQLEMEFEFPYLKPGENTIIIHEGDAVIKIKRKDRWL